ncbi:MAG: NAD-dependent succinate-semialdehyde dehydrogenase [Myxococcota bacterium]
MSLEVVDPNTGATLRVVTPHGDEDVEERLNDAVSAWGKWRRTSFEHRAEVLRDLAQVIEERADECALRMAQEMGKPVAQGVREVRKCAQVCRFYARVGPGWMADTAVDVGPGSEVRVQNDALGLVLAIMPWNYPYWQAIRFLAPALMAGNGVLLKHAARTSGVCLDLESLLLDAGAPPGLVPALLIDNEATGRLVDDPRVAAVTLTGSTGAGRAVGRRAGGALKPHVLELGGSDPFVVLADADVDRAAEVGAKARLQNAGQSCIAAKRFIVEEAVAQRFIEGLRAHMAAAVVGDPADPETEVGPLARQDLRRTVHEQVRLSIDAGARCVLGGEIPRGTGWFYPPTVLLDVGPGQPAWEDEIFGPVASVRVVPDAEAALEAANESRFGLGASVWTRDPELQERFAREVRAGAVFLNGMTRSDPRVPFGGVGHSGHGRELARDGLMSFVNRKTVWRDESGRGQ